MSFFGFGKGKKADDDLDPETQGAAGVASEKSFDPDAEGECSSGECLPAMCLLSFAVSCAVHNRFDIEHVMHGCCTAARAKINELLVRHLLTMPSARIKSWQILGGVLQARRALTRTAGVA